MKKLSSTLPNMLLSLVGICLVAAALLGAMYQVTKEPIDAAKVKGKVEAIAEVIPGFDNNPYREQFKELAQPNDKDSVVLYPAGKGGVPLGFAVESYSDNGFAGRITVMAGFDMKGTLLDFKVLEQNETPGLGTKMQEWFHSGKTQQEAPTGFQTVKGITMDKPLQVSKDGGSVDAITAATITSRAFLDAVNRAHAAAMRAIKNTKQ